MNLKRYAKKINTPLGTFTAIGDDKFLHGLTFQSTDIEEGSSISIASIEQELDQYFSKKLKQFKTPLHFEGTPFQIAVWQALQKIPFGKTWSYSELAIAINKPTAYRAVAQANGANHFCIIIPCHRVINADGNLGGYNGGIWKKEWLLKHEQ